MRSNKFKRRIRPERTTKIHGNPKSQNPRRGEQAWPQFFHSLVQAWSLFFGFFFASFSLFFQAQFKFLFIYFMFFFDKYITLWLCIYSFIIFHIYIYIYLENFIILEYEFPKSKATVYRAAWRMEYLNSMLLLQNVCPLCSFSLPLPTHTIREKNIKKEKKRKDR